MKKILFINACVREDESRTLYLCRQFLEMLTKKSELGIDLKIQEVDLTKLNLLPLDHETIDRRESLAMKKDFSDKMFEQARLFSEAHVILIGAPYWDLSFPSILKIYIENIFVTNLTFTYGENGMPQSLCNCEKLMYISTVGGYIGKFTSAKQYIADICDFFGIGQREFHFAEGLDIKTNNAEEILKRSVYEFDELARRFV